MKKSKPRTAPVSASSRRSFLGKMGSAAALTATAGLTQQSLAQNPLTKQNSSDVEKTIQALRELSASPEADNRLVKSLMCRLNAATMAMQRPAADQVTNGDDERYFFKIGSYTKGLPHNQLGLVDLNAYATLARARTSQDPADFERIQLGLGRKLTSPQAGLAMDLEGADSHHVTLPPPPQLSSAEEAGEAVELYWMALARDVNFSDFENSAIIANAAAEISALSDFRGPRDGVRQNAERQTTVNGIASARESANTRGLVSVREGEAPRGYELLSGRKNNGAVTAKSIFRGNTPGDLTGPWISQFLLLDFSFGANFFSQKMRTLPAGINYMTKYQDWLDVQNGADPGKNIQYDPTPRYMRNLRDLSQWVHVDALYQAYLQACLIMLGQGTRVDPGLPLYDTKVQAGFAQCGGPHILSLVTEVATRALKAVWYQKWFVHHRLRPEEFGGLVHNHLSRAANHPLHSDILNSRVAAETFSKNGSYLLPQAFPEGSPTHSAYGSGHATVAGACTTILKAFFDENQLVKNPMVPTPDGTALVPYTGAELTIGGELNKVAANVSIGRCGAGVHWRTDAINAMTLGETIAIGILEEQKLTYNDNVQMTLTKFDGTKITI